MNHLNDTFPPTDCQVLNHNPICICAPGYTGDPFTRCFKQPIVETSREPINPCLPNPCGPNSECRVVGESPACSCLPNYHGTAPNCRPECTISAQCPANQACMNQRCVNPCPGSCGINSNCVVINHTPSCSCDPHYTGDAFQGCSPVQSEYHFIVSIYKNFLKIKNAFSTTHRFNEFKYLTQTENSINRTLLCMEVLLYERYH